MGVVKNFVVRAGADFSELDKELKNASKNLKKAGQELTKIGKSLTMGITLPIVGAGAASFKLASDMEESINKVDVAFGSSADVIKDWSEDTLHAYGISQGAALDMAALFGDMGTAMGFADKDAADMSKSLVGLAGDLASFKNIGIDQAETALKSIFTGETESLKNLGIVMTQANLNAYALSQGINKTVQEMSQAEQVQLRYAYVMEMTKNAQGDFNRTSDGAANQMRIFTESLKELGAAFGTILLPIITPIIEKLNGLVQKFGALDEGTKKNIVTALLLAAAIGPLMMALGGLATGIGKALLMASKFTTAIKAGKTVLSALGVMMGPAGLVTIGILAFAAAAFLVIKNWDSIKAFFSGLGENIKGIFEKIKDFVTGIFDTIASHIKAKINTIIDFFNIFIRGLNKIKIKMPSWLGGGEWKVSIPQIPKLAEGGIVTQPTLAMIGEAGPEAVVPLDKGMGGNITINVRSPFDVAKEVDFIQKKLAWGI